jgi:hypothetical protein
LAYFVSCFTIGAFDGLHQRQLQVVTIERRKSLRYKFDGALAITWGGAALSGRVREIGPDGMFIEIANPLWIGAAFSAQLVAEKPMLFDCVVRWVEPRSGMGVSIVALGEEGRKRFAAFLDTLSGE